MKEITTTFGDNPLAYGTHHGIDYQVRMANFSINGYVELPEGHPYIGADLYAEQDIIVHGGVTFQAGRVIGFDTNHAGDAPHPESPYYCDEVSYMEGHVWTAEEVLTETLRLCEAVAKAGKGA